MVEVRVFVEFDRFGLDELDEQKTVVAIIQAAQLGQTVQLGGECSHYWMRLRVGASPSRDTDSWIKRQTFLRYCLVGTWKSSMRAEYLGQAIGSKKYLVIIFYKAQLASISVRFMSISLIYISIFTFLSLPKYSKSIRSSISSLSVVICPFDVASSPLFGSIQLPYNSQLPTTNLQWTSCTQTNWTTATRSTTASSKNNHKKDSRETNKRLLLMLEGHFISYLSQPNLHFTFTKDYISKHAKMILPLVQINKVIDRHQDKKIIIHFWIYEKQKRVEKVWNLRFENFELLQRWMEKFQEENNMSRKGTGSINIKQDENQSNLEYAQKLIRRMSRQDNMQDANRPQQDIQFPGNFQTQPQPYNPLPQDTNPAYSRNFPQPSNENDSYFSNTAFTTPIPSKQPGQTYQQALIIQNSKMKDRSIYFSNTNFSTSKKYNFKNYYRPYLDSIVKNPNNIAKGSQLVQASAKFDRQLEYSKQCVVTLVQEKLEKLKELQCLKDIKLRIMEDTPNWIRFTQFGSTRKYAHFIVLVLNLMPKRFV